MGRVAQFIRVAVAAALLGGGATAHADLYVIAHAAHVGPAMTRAETLDLFMGRTRHFPGGQPALPVDQPRNSAARARFYRALTGMDLAQVNSYWARLMFSGQTMPPQPLAGEAAVVEAVRHNPSAIGYVVTAPTGLDVRVMFVLEESP